MTKTAEDIKRVKKGPNDLEELIDQLKKQKEFLQFKCRQAGKALLDLEIERNVLIKDVDRLTEENSNLKTMLRKQKNGH